MSKRTKTYCMASVARIAEEMGVSDRSVNRYLLELRNFGLIETQQRGFGKTAAHHFLASKIFTDIYASSPDDVEDEEDSEPSSDDVGVGHSYDRSVVASCDKTVVTDYDRSVVTDYDRSVGAYKGRSVEKTTVEKTEEESPVSPCPYRHTHPDLGRNLYPEPEPVSDLEATSPPIPPPPSPCPDLDVDTTLKWVKSRLKRLKGMKLNSARETKRLREAMEKSGLTENQWSQSLEAFIGEDYWVEYDDKLGAFLKFVREHGVKFEPGTPPEVHVLAAPGDAGGDFRGRGASSHAVGANGAAVGLKTISSSLPLKAETWNRLVESGPKVEKWNMLRDPPIPADPEFEREFEALCAKAETIHRQRESEVGWLTFRWLVKNWWKLAVGELDWMMVKRKKGQTSSDVEILVAESMRQLSEG
jgi:hypothetical protein